MIVGETSRPPSDNDNSADGAGKRASRIERPFDRWLNRQLHEMYDATVREALPEGLIRLIERDAADALDTARLKEPVP